MSSRKQYYERKKAGLCVKCGEPRLDSPSKIKCASCHEGKKIKPAAKQCIYCKAAPAVENQSCEDCSTNSQKIKEKLTHNKVLAVNPQAEEGKCRVCAEDIDNLGLVCNACLKATTFTKNDALACYIAQCVNCSEQDVTQLRFISSNIDEPMPKSGAALYKNICFSKRQLPAYAVACYACYHQMCVDYVREVRHFFHENKDTDDQDIIDLV